MQMLLGRNPRYTEYFLCIWLGVALLSALPAKSFPTQAVASSPVMSPTEARAFKGNRALAKSYLRQNKTAQAIPFLEKARTLNPTDFDNGYDLALAYTRTGQLEKARAQAKFLVTIRDSADLHTLLGNIESAAHSAKPAASEYQIAAHMDPSEDRIFDFGRSLLIFGSDAAIRVFSYGVEKYPNSTRLRIGLGAAFDIHGNYDKAAEVLCQAMDMDPADPQPVDFLGKLPTVSPETAKQIDQRLSLFLKTHPGNAQASYYRARNLLNPSAREPSKAEMAEGERLLRAAIQLNPKLADAYFELGWLCEREGRQNEATQFYGQAIKRNPSQAKYHFRLSYVYRATGQTVKAGQEIQIFQRLQATQDAAFSSNFRDNSSASHN